MYEVLGSLLHTSAPVQCRNVARWRPSAPTAPPFGAPPLLKVEGKIGQLKLF